MKKVIKQTILALATITCLSLTPLFTESVNAISAGAALGVVVGSGLNPSGDEKENTNGKTQQI